MVECLCSLCFYLKAHFSSSSRGVLDERHNSRSNLLKRLCPPIFPHTRDLSSIKESKLQSQRRRSAKENNSLCLYSSCFLKGKMWILLLRIFFPYFASTKNIPVSAWFLSGGGLGLSSLFIFLSLAQIKVSSRKDFVLNQNCELLCWALNLPFLLYLEDLF